MKPLSNVYSIADYFPSKMAKRKFIIDCDAGVDDAFAIILALDQPDVDVLAVTCVGGNTGLDYVCINVMKVLEVCKRTEIPVYKGASKSLVGKNICYSTRH